MSRLASGFWLGRDVEERAAQKDGWLYALLTCLINMFYVLKDSEQNYCWVWLYYSAY